MLIGDPPVLSMIVLSTTFSELILVDSRCGYRNPICPRYCDNDALSKAYCSSDCQSGYLPYHRVTYCSQADELKDSLGVWHEYSSENSTTSTTTNIEWIGKQLGYETLRGRVVYDQIKIPSNMVNTTDISTNEFILSNALMIDGFALDARILGYFQGIAGLAMGEKNFVLQAFNQRVIPAAIITIVLPSTIGFVKFGAYEEEVCEEWTHHPVLNNMWGLTVDSLKFLNFTSTTTRIQIDNTLEIVYVPNEIVDDLVSRGLLSIDDPTELIMKYTVDCSLDLDLCFELTGQQFCIQSKHLKTYIFSTLCSANIRPVRDYWNGHRYTTEPTFLIGVPFFRDYCVAYNYENNQIGLAANKLN
ncbi:Eukaryotic aspartyl protease [Aphelenchoides besseyi]|nr:Eukaryotic aspartyl protease [Aphelenchoides besseyi]